SVAVSSVSPPARPVNKLGQRVRTSLRIAGGARMVSYLLVLGGLAASGSPALRFISPLLRGPQPMRLSQLLQRLRRSRKSGLRPRRKIARLPLALEALETRLVPTVFFHPVFEAPAVDNDGGVLTNPIVNLIFWGPDSFWGTPGAPSSI